MAVKFFNIRSGLSALAETEPQLAALWSSSDHSPNITQGQDLGWRMAPEVVVEMKSIKQDIEMLERIARKYRKALEDVTEIDILHWISDKTAPEAAPIAHVDQYADDYDNQVQAAERAARSGFDKPAETETTTLSTTQSIAQLEAELAKRKAAEEPPATTSTTTAKPVK